MTSLTPTTWLLILFAVVPGFVANRAFALWCPSSKQDWEKAVLEPITWSAVNLILWWWLVVPIIQKSFDQLSGVELSWVTFLVCVVSPTILAGLWYRFRKSAWAHQTLRLDHPTPRGWDFFLHKCKNCFVLIHTKDGRMVGGYYGAESYASTFPQEPEIHLEQVWRVNQTSGEFDSPIEGSLGLVMRQTDWERIEFFECPKQPDEEAQNGGQTKEAHGEQPTPIGPDCNGGSTGGPVHGGGAGQKDHNGDGKANGRPEGGDGNAPEAAPAQELNSSPTQLR